jgi:hypothetical protein
MNTDRRGQGPRDERRSIFQVVDRLTLAASPVFGFMALLTFYDDGARDLPCGMVDGTPWNGMATMYLLMCAAHLPPWLKLLSRRRIACIEQRAISAETT